MKVYGHIATSVVHALQWLPQHQGRVETQTGKNKTSSYWQSWVSHTCWSSPKEKEMTCLGVYDHECLIWKGFFAFGHAEPMWNHSSPTRETTTGPPGKSLRVFFFSFLLRLCSLQNAFPISESVDPQLHTMIDVNPVGYAAWLSGRECPAWATLGCWVNEMIH